MEMAWKIYWLTRLPDLGSFANDIIAFCVFGCFVGIAVYGFCRFEIYSDPDDEDRKRLKEISQYPKIFAQIAIVCGLISVLIPSRNDLLLIFGGQAAFEIANNQQVSGIVKDGLSLIQDEINKARENKK